MLCATALLLASLGQTQPYVAAKLNVMVEQSGVILHNLILDMNKQDLTNMTARMENGYSFVGGVLRPGESLSMTQRGPGSDYHNLIAAASNVNAQIAFRIRDAKGKIVRDVRSEDAGGRIYSSARESHDSTANWTYEVVNTAKSGDPIFATMLLTRSGDKGTAFTAGDFYKSVANLAKQVKEMSDENWGVMTGRVSLVGGYIAAGTNLTMGPYGMQDSTFVVTASDGRTDNARLYLLKPSSDAVLAEDTDSGTEPFAGLSGQSGVNIKLQNASTKGSIMCYAVMKQP